MSDNYSITVKIEPTGLDSAGFDVGHAFVTLHAPGQKDITVGFYPEVHAGYASGVLRDDSVSGRVTNSAGTIIGVEPHPSTSSMTFIVSEKQFSDMLSYASNIANNPSDMYNGITGLPVLLNPQLGLLIGSGSNVCTDFVRNILAIGEINPPLGNLGENMIPQSLSFQFGLLGRDQRVADGSPAGKYASQISADIQSLTNGIEKYDPTYVTGPLRAGAPAVTINNPLTIDSVTVTVTGTALNRDTVQFYLSKGLAPDGSPLGRMVTDNVTGEQSIWVRDGQGGVVSIISNNGASGIRQTYETHFDASGFMDRTTDYTTSATGATTRTDFIYSPSGEYTPVSSLLISDNNFSGGNYTIKSGDTLWDIANRNGLTADELIAANPQITHPGAVSIGQVIRLPAAPANSSSVNITTNTTASTTTSQTTGETPVSADNSTLINNGISNVQGVGNVNVDAGIKALINDFISDGIRPGNNNLSTNSYLFDFISIDFISNNSSGQALGANALNNASAGLPKFIPTDPLVLDLNGDGVKLTNYKDAPVLFDIDHDSGATKEQTGWVSAQDGIVVYDLNNNGKIDDISETLSEYFNGAVGTNGSGGTKPYANGLAALKSLDSNNDNQFTSADTAWTNVKVWVDANHDGITDAGELKTLSSLNITSINLNQTIQSGLVRDGNEILASSTFVQNGQTKEALAANFIANPNGSTFATSGTGTLTTTEGNVKSYTAGNAGETVDVAQKGVNNAQGGTGNDTLTGDSTNNWLVGNLGADIINAGAGDDVILFDSLDTIDGGDGTDIAQVVGDEGVTLNLAQSHIEVAVGGRGDDILIGGGRSSVFVKGGEGDDIIIGGAANDVLSGEDGSDVIDGGAGNDLIRGHRGQDQLMGGAGDDIVEGGQDDDNLSGGAGNDVLNGGQGDDTIDGGEGNDIVQFSGSYADYRITKISANGQTTYRITDTLGREGTDTVTNVEKISFKDVNWVTLDDPAPMAVKDILDKSSTGSQFTRSGLQLINISQLLGNDIDRQNDTLHITVITDVQGGTIVGTYNAATKEWTPTLTANGEIQFNADPNFKGIMGFKYSVADTASNQMQVTDVASGQMAPMKAAVYLRTVDIPNDPLIVDQWYLSEANVIPVWQNYTGKGIKIGQFEPGGNFSVGAEILDITHPDLKPNLDSNWLANTANNIPDTYSTHATLVAGVIAAAKNGEGGAGVAYDAKLAGYYITNDGSDLNALKKMTQYDIANNSWGARTNFNSNFATNSNLENVYQYAVANGRNGLGTNIVMAGGNERAKGGNTNYQALSNNRYSIVVGGINAKTDLGSLQVGGSPFSNPGASILVSAPASNVQSTGRLIEADNGSTFGSDYSVNQGTSFATPIVSGVIALMLEANSKLGYRDVQEILAISSRKVADGNTAWVDNHASNWNGGGMHVSHDYGYGEVDALAAVRLAETWNTQQTWINEYESNSFSSGSLNVSITDNNATGISRSISVTNTPLKIEHVEVAINLTHANAGDLILKLISPTGTESILVHRPGKTPGSVTSDTGDVSFDGSNTLNFTFDTVRDWGESPNGNWTLQVVDANTGAVGTLNSWALKFFGKNDNGDDTYYYTNEYAGLSGRNVLAVDSDSGEDTVNVAAATGNSIVNLNTGSALVAGRALTLSTPANLENAIGGEGDDTLTGNAASNKLIGGRGNDTLSGGAGTDYLFGGLGNNTMSGGTETDIFVIDQKAGAVDTITDFQVGVDRIVLSAFGSNTYANISLIQEGAHVRASLGGAQSILVQNVTVAQLTAEQFLSIKGGLNPRELNGYTSFTYGSDAYLNQSYWTSGDTSYWAGDNIGNTGSAEAIFGGSGNDRIYGGAGNDQIVGENSSGSTTGGNDFLSGEDGVDTIYGGGGDDTLWGGANIDFLDGGYGNDVLNLEGDEGVSSAGGLPLNGTYLGNVTANAALNGAAVQGGAGNDRFVVIEDISSTASQGLLRNIINDFEVANPNEKIDLSGIRSVSSFADLSFKTFIAVVDGVNQNFLRIWLGQPALGAQYITLKNVTQAQLSAANFIFNDGILPEPIAKNALINGSTGSDVLNGDAGGNTINGNAGADIMSGRTGDDTYIVDNTGDVVNELPGGGYDSVKSSVTHTLSDNVEQLTLTGTNAITGTGNSQANRIVGNSAANILDGKGGSDDLVGGLGNDTYVVDVGTDRVTENANEGTDTVQSSVSWTLGQNLENLTLTGTSNINATGNALNNLLIGNAVDNTLDGAEGGDSLQGGAGDDTYFVDNTGDVITENLNEGIDTIYTSVNLGRNLDANVENIILFGNATAATGNDLDNMLVGNDLSNALNGGNGNDSLDGGLGTDTLIGGAGNDIYVVDSTTDTITEAANGGTDTVQSSVTYTLGASSNLESLTLTGAAAINGTGNTLDNVLVGNAANNTLTGGAGNDTLNGGAGTDTLVGGDGNDIYIVDSSTDTITETSTGGTDTVQSSVSYTLGATSNLENLTLTGAAAINGTGNTLNNVITGNSGSNTLIGGAGNDTYVLNTGFGQDVIIDTDSTAGNIDILQFGTGISSSTTQVSRSGNNLILTVGSNVATLQNWFSSAANQIEQVKFVDNPTVTWDVSTLTAMANAAPTITNMSASEGYTEDVALNLVDMVITDSDSTTHTATLTLSNVAAGALNTATSGSVTSTYNATTGVWTASGATASVNALLAGLTFSPAANANGNFTIATSISDGVNTVTGSKSFTGSAVNDAPTAANATLTTNEDTAKVFALSDFGFSDVDAGNTLQSVTITSLPGAGNLRLNGVAVTANQVITAANITSGLLTFTTAANANGAGYANIGFKVSDGTAVSATANTLTINVTAVNDAPTAANATLTANEDTAKVFAQSDFGFSDVDAGNTLQSVTITTLPGAGNLRLNGVAVTANQVITAANITSGLLTFTPAANANGAGYANIGFKVSDGTAVSATANTLTINVTAVNDAPTATNLAASETYTKNVALNLNDIVITDVDSATHTATLTVSNVAAGSLNTATSGGVTSTYNASTGVWTASGATANVNALLAGLTFTPTANYTGSFTIATSVSDGVAAVTGTKSFSANSGDIMGTADDDTLVGTTANDVIQGLAGNDRLDGDTGIDTLVGGDGNDTYIVDTTTDTITETATGGIDTVQSSVTFSLASLVNLENLTLTGTAAINGTGNALDNTIIGNAAANTLNGGAGADSMMGGDGNDVYIVDDSSDLITETATGGTDTVQSLITYTLVDNVEKLTLSGTLSINGTGNALNNTLTGNAANNVLTGGAGNDALNGGAGIDTLMGGDGDDTYVVDTTTDTIIELSTGGTDTVQSSVSFTLGDYLEKLTLIGTAAVNGTGNASNNALTGNTANNTLDGGAGNDTLNGGGGTDTLIGGDGDDTYIVDSTTDLITESATGGFDTIQSSVSFGLGAYLEKLTLTGGTSINGFGNELNNMITGNAANNLLSGGAGNDSVSGAAGNDILQGMTGADSISDTAGNNLLDGGDDIDSLSASTGNDIMVGGKGNDTITTNTGYDVVLFNKGDGADIIAASVGTDNTLSLGGNFAYSDLSLTKSSTDLILNMGTDQITFKSWYNTAANNKSVLNLQVIAEAMQGFSLGGADTLRNNKVETFNFANLVAAFDAAGATANWQLTDARLSAHLSAGSDTAAIGGDIAYQYGKAGSLTGVGLLAAQAVMNNASVGQSAQTLNAASSWSAETIKLS